MMRRNYFILAVFAIAGAFGCQAILGIDDTTFTNVASSEAGADAANDAPTGDASPPGDAATSASITLTPSLVRLSPGSSADVAVALERAGVTGNVTLQIEGLDGGVSAASIVIADETSTGTLHLTASASAAFGSQLVNVHPSIATIPDAPLTVLVPAPPGTVDDTFAGGEAAFASGGDANASGVAVGVQKNNSVVVAVVSGSGTGWVIVRLDPNGVLDSVFNANSAAVLPTTGSISDLVIGASDDIYAVGTSTPTQNQLTVVHLLADGTRDNLFGTNGVTVLDNVDFSQGSTGSGIAVQSDNRPIAVGATKQGASSAGLVVRFNKDGSRDDMFGNSGRQDFSDTQTLRRVAVTADDRIAAGGTDSNFMLTVHLLASGALDTSFSPTGAVDGTSVAMGGFDISVRPDAGYVVVGVDNQGIGGCAITQFALLGDASAEADETYPGTNNGRCGAVATQPDGKFLIVGGYGGSEDHTGFILRMVSLTTRDPSFNDAGGVIYAADHSITQTVPYRFFNDVTVGPDGRIVAVGMQMSAGVLVVRVWP